MKLIKVDFIKTNEQVRHSGKLDVTELYIDLDSINGLMVSREMTAPGKYKATIVDGKEELETIEEPEYEYSYMVALQNQQFPTINTSKESYDKITNILKQRSQLLC